MLDEYQGEGGTYSLNPKTGKRKLIEQTKPALQTTQEALSDAPAKPQTPDPGQG